MDSVVEILLWLIISMVVFYVCNTILGLRTAASLFLAFLIGSLIIFFCYRSLFGEIVIMFAIVVGLIYGFFRAIRDRRDDKLA